MAWLDFIKRIRQDEEEEKNRPQGGMYGFLDDVLDVGERRGSRIKKAFTPQDEEGYDIGNRFQDVIGGLAPEITKDVAGGAAGLLRGMTTGAYRNFEESLDPTNEKRKTESIDMLLEISEDERKKILADDKDPRNATLRVLTKNLGGDVSDKRLRERKDEVKKEAEERRRTGFVPESTMDKALFGNDPVQGFGRRREGLEKEAGWNPIVATGATGLNMALDLPLGKPVGIAKELGEQTFKTIAKSVDADEIAKQLGKSRIARRYGEDAIRELSERLTTITDSKEAKDLVSNTFKSNFEKVTDPVKDRVTGATSEFVSRLDPRRPAAAVDDVAAAADEVPTDPTRPFMDRLTPQTETPAVKPPVAPPDGEYELLGHIKTSKEIKDMQPKKGLMEKIKGSVDKYRSLKVFGETVKDNTGRVLNAEEDPHKLAQLRNGLQDAALQRVRPAVEALEKSPDINETRVLGVARQIMDRARMPEQNLPTEIIEKARRDLARLEAKYGGEIPKELEDSVGSVVEHYSRTMDELEAEEIISPELRKMIDDQHQDYFTRFEIVDHLLERGAKEGYSFGGSLNLARQDVVKAIKGLSDEGRFQILDPVESLFKSTMASQKAIMNNRILKSLDDMKDDVGDLIVPIKDADETVKRIGLMEDNADLRKVKNSLIRLIRSDKRALRAIASEAYALEKKGLELSLKEGGQTIPKFTPGGLGGKVPTSQAGKGPIREAVTEGEEGLLGAMGIANNPSKLGPQDTVTFLRNLIEGPPARLAQIKKSIDLRDRRMADVFGQLETLKNEFDDVAGTMRANSDEAREYVQKQVPKGYTVISGFRNGMQQKLAIPTEIADDYMGKTEGQRDQLMQMINGVGRVFKESVTTLSIPFAFVTNPIRDYNTLKITSQAIPTKDFMLVVPFAKRWLRGLYDGVTNSELSQAVSREGGGSAGIYNDTRSPEQVARSLVKKVEGRKPAGEVIKSPKELAKLLARLGTAVPRGAYRGIRNAGRAIEYAPRLAEARAVREKGGSDIAAASAARNATVDFQNAKGLVTVLNNYATFFSARALGTANVIRGIKNNPKKAAAIITTQIAAPAMAAYAWNWSQYPEVMEQIDQDTQDRYYIIVTGDGVDEKGNPKDIIKFPKTEIDKVFANNVDNMMRYIQKNDPKSFAQTVAQTIGNSMPADVLDSEGNFSASRAVGSIIPPAAKGPIQYVTGHNLYYDQPTVADKYANLPDEMQVREDDPYTEEVEASTPFVDRAVAAVLPGEQSPMRLQQLRQDMTGQLFTKNPLKGLQDATTGARGNRVENEFYSIQKKTAKERNGVSKEINKAIEDNDYEKAYALAEEHNRNVEERFGPWIDKYGDTAPQKLVDEYDRQRLTINRKTLKQRRSQLLKKQLGE